MPTTRRAHGSDAEKLAVLAETTFRETFEAENSRENMDQHCQTSYNREIQAAEIADPETLTLLSVREDSLLGYARLRWKPAPACVGGRAPGEIQRIYVSKAYQGKGIARELMNACIAEMMSRKTEVIWLGVWERNPRAIAFYRKFGFYEIGDHLFTLGTDPQRDIIMARRGWFVPASR